MAPQNPIISMYHMRPGQATPTGENAESFSCRSESADQYCCYGWRDEAFPAFETVSV